MLNSTRPIIDWGSLMLEPSLQEFLIFICRTVKHLWLWLWLCARSLCLAPLALGCPRRLMTINHIGDISRHAEKVVGQRTDVLRWNDLVHTDVKVLSLL